MYLFWKGEKNEKKMNKLIEQGETLVVPTDLLTSLIWPWDQRGDGTWGPGRTRLKVVGALRWPQDKQLTLPPIPWPGCHVHFAEEEIKAIVGNEITWWWCRREPTELGLGSCSLTPELSLLLLTSSLVRQLLGSHRAGFSFGLSLFAGTLENVWSWLGTPRTYYYWAFVYLSLLMGC